MAGSLGSPGGGGGGTRDSFGILFRILLYLLSDFICVWWHWYCWMVLRDSFGIFWGMLWDSLIFRFFWGTLMESWIFMGFLWDFWIVLLILRDSLRFLWIFRGSFGIYVGSFGILWFSFNFQGIFLEYFDGILDFYGIFKDSWIVLLILRDSLGFSDVRWDFERIFWVFLRIFCMIYEGFLNFLIHFSGFCGILWFSFNFQEILLGCFDGILDFSRIFGLFSWFYGILRGFYGSVEDLSGFFDLFKDFLDDLWRILKFSYSFFGILWDSLYFLPISKGFDWNYLVFFSQLILQHWPQ